MQFSRGLLCLLSLCHSSLNAHSLEHTIKRLPPHRPSTKTTPNIPLEPLAINLQILCSLLVQRITRIRLEEQELQPDHHRVQIQHGLPVLAQDVQAHVALEVDVGVVDLLRAFDLGRIVRKVLVDCEAEDEAAAFVHALVRVDGEREVEDVVGVGEVGFHRCAERELFEIWVVAKLACGGIAMRGI